MERLTPLSAAFLDAEDADASAALAIGSLAIFDGPAPDFEDFVAAIEGRLPLIPRYRQRLRTVPLDLGAPAWVDDTDFDLRWHLRRIALPSPGGRAEVGEMMSREMAERMDRSRPLWQYTVVEGLPDGRWGLLSKVHHSMVDGVSGTDLYRLVLDPTPEPQPGVPDTWRPHALESSASFIGSAARDLALTPVRVTGALARGLLTPRRTAVAAAHSARGMLQFGTAMTPTHHSSLTGRLDGARRYEWTDISLDDIRAVRKAFGCTVNDVALACVTGGFRRLLESRGEEPHPHTVRTLVPVSTRAPGTADVPGNEVSLLLPYLPVEIAEPRLRLAAVQDRLRTLKASHEADFGDTMTSWAALGPFLPVNAGIRLGMHLPQQVISTVTTNVPGPQQPLYCLGRQAREMLPYVPIAERVRIGIAMFSYDGTLSFGITGDFDAARDLDLLAEGIAASMQELLHAAR